VTTLTALEIADPIPLWAALGFSLDEGVFWVSGVRHRLGVPGLGVTQWGLHPANGFKEVPTHDIEHGAAASDHRHPNGVIALDHVVIATPNMARTVTAFESCGMPLRRTRAAGSPSQPMTQSFFKAGDVVIEVVGAPDATEPEPARIWGLTYTVSDLDATAAQLGDRLRPIRGAVQRGRRIATLDRAAGSTVPIAFMSDRAVANS
jgi:hypothetical protein